VKRLPREAVIFFVFLTLCLTIYCFNHNFISPLNVKSILRQISFFGIMALGSTLVIISGGIDLSPGSVMALTGVVVAMLMRRGFAVWGAILLTLFLSGVIGLWHGFFVCRLRVPPFIITLGTLSIARGVATLLTRGNPITDLPPSFLQLDEWDCAGYIQISTIVLVLSGITCAVMMGKTVLGRHIYAVGGNLEAARLSGVRIDFVRTFCYVAAAVFAGIVGILNAAFVAGGRPGVGVAYELNAIAAAVIGGTSLMGGEGTILGTIIGAAIMSVVDNGLVLLPLASGVSAYWRDVVIGAVIVTAVTLDMMRKQGE